MLIMMILSLFISYYVSAATHPLTGSSIINNAQNNLALSQMGFSIAGIPADWKYQLLEDNSTFTMKLGPKDKTLMSLKVEAAKIKRDQFENHVRKQIKEYNQYGFEVVQLKSQTTIPPTIEIELKQKNNQTKSIQFFLYREDRIAIATCADVTQTFEMTKRSCKDIAASFRWNH